VLAFAFAVTVVTGILFGIAPALQLSRTDLNTTLKDGAKGSSGGALGRVRSGLVVTEVALSLLLLVGAGLLMRSFLKLRSVDLGFEPEHVLTAWVSKYLPYSEDWVGNAEKFAQFHRQVLERLREIPGVKSVGGSNTFPFTTGEGERSRVEFVTRSGSGDSELHRLPALTFDVSPGFFSAMGIPLLRGREFDDRDRKGAPMTIIINKRTADTVFRGRDPIGQEIKWGGLENTRQPWCVIVGVAGDIRYRPTESATGLEFYYPYTQWPTPGFRYVLRTTRDPAGLTTEVRQAVAAVDRDTAVIEVKPMNRVIDDSVWQRRLWGTLFAAFAVLAMVLAAVGLYGVMSYLVSQRTREIGVRMALGSSQTGVLRLVMGEGMRLVGIGLVLGIAGALTLGRSLRSLLFGVTSFDAATLIGVPLALAAIALVACYMPARRASRIDPLRALRQE
jgi:putative ABC transport system permease protein